MNYKQLPGRCSKCHKWDKGVKRVRTKNLRENGKEGSGSFSLLHSMQKNTDRLVWLLSDTGIALNSLLDCGSDTIYWLYILAFIVMPILLISLLLLLLLSLLQTCDSSHLASAWIRYEPETLALRKRPVYEKKGSRITAQEGEKKHSCWRCCWCDRCTADAWLALLLTAETWPAGFTYILSFGITSVHHHHHHYLMLSCSWRGSATSSPKTCGHVHDNVSKVFRNVIVPIWAARAACTYDISA